MRQSGKAFLMLSLLTIFYANVCAQFKPGKSIYTQKVEDPQAVFFTPNRADNKTDISDQLQAAMTK